MIIMIIWYNFSELCYINLATLQGDLFVSKANHSVSKRTLYLFAKLIKREGKANDM